MITVYLNHEPYSIKPGLSLHELLLTHHHTELHCAIAVNNQVIPRTSYSTTLLHDCDSVDIIVPMQGG